MMNEVEPSRKKTSQEKNKLPILVYDHECVLCTRFKQALERLPGSSKLSAVSAHDEDLYTQFPILNREECLQTVHVLDAEGNVRKGADAMAWIIEQFPGATKFTWLLESGMGKKAVEYFHEMASHYRAKSLQKSCPKCNKSH